MSFPITPVSAETRLVLLLRQHGDYYSGEALCREMGMTRAAVWKYVCALRTHGYVVEACTHRGYRLTSAPDTPFPAEVLARLSTARLGRDCQYHRETDSTNRLAVAQGESGAAEGSLVVADAQTGGRGRMGRSWWSPPGVNLYFSLLLRPQTPPMQAPSLALVAGLALHRTVRQLAPHVNSAAKWPNDVWISGRKVAGVLCDMRSEADRIHFLVMGIGVNINLPDDQLPPALLPVATSLAAAAGHGFCRAAVLATFLNQFEPLYDAWQRDGLAPLVSELAACSPLANRLITVTGGQHEIRGTVCGLSPTGALLLRLANGQQQAIVAGDVHLT